MCVENCYLCTRIEPSEGSRLLRLPCCCLVLLPLVARRAARLNEGRSTRTVRVPQRGTLCVPRQVEFRSRLIKSGSAGLPFEKGATPGAAVRVKDMGNTRVQRHGLQFQGEIVISF